MSINTSSKGNMGFRASNALASIQAFQDNSKNAIHRASTNLGMSDGTPKGSAELKMENERLKTTLMILNQSCSGISPAFPAGQTTGHIITIDDPNFGPTSRKYIVDIPETYDGKQKTPIHFY